VTTERLSALDASFLAVETPDAPMHVGWVAVFEAPAEGKPSFDELSAHLASRLTRAHRYRQKLVPVPLGVHEPVWVDDDAFDPAAHVLHAPGEDLDAIVDEILSTPLPRDRPLWRMWIADELPGDEIALIGKAHHCMVDGAAVAELGKVVLDASPDATEPPSSGSAVSAASTGPAPSAASPGASTGPAPWTAAPTPSPRSRLARAVLDRAADGAALALTPFSLARRPNRVPQLAARGARTLTHTLLPPAPPSPLNVPGSARRHHVRVVRPLDEVRQARRRYGVTPNDVILAACAGAIRRYLERRGDVPQRLKAMVPADVRGAEDDPASGNRISFVFVELPCDEPDPVARLEAINRATAQRRRDEEAEGLDAAFGVLALTPRSLQRALAHAFAHPRLSNLTISTMPGPSVPRYLSGCLLRTVHSAVPLAERHALSIGIVMVAGSACVGVYAAADALPDADSLRGDLHAAFDELVASA
jgi:diacylglycerol O-acyltransferase